MRRPIRAAPSSTRPNGRCSQRLRRASTGTSCSARWWRRRTSCFPGATGSGKTTFGKALIREIPAHERLITIEDAKELNVDDNRNHVRLFYSQGAQGQADVTVHTLLVSCLRMRPDRILLAELRKDEAYFYLEAISSGHPGAITSVHANSARLVFERVISMVREGPGGANLAGEDIRRFLTLLVDVIVQFRKDERADGSTVRRVAEIWYDPLIKRQRIA